MISYNGEQNFSFFLFDDPYCFRKTMRENNKRNLTIKIPNLTDLNKDAPEFSPIVNQTENLIKELERVCILPPGFSKKQ